MVQVMEGEMYTKQLTNLEYFELFDFQSLLISA